MNGINPRRANGNAEQCLKQRPAAKGAPTMPDLADLFPGYASEWINTSAGR